MLHPQRMMIHMDRVLADNEYYISNPKGRQDLKFNEEFEIKHYAGTVKYSILGFMDKNKVQRTGEASSLLGYSFMKCIIYTMSSFIGFSVS